MQQSRANSGLNLRSKTRPKNLNLFTIKFPIPAIVSILHRVSGAILFLFIPFLIWGLSFSLTSDGFDTLKDWTSYFIIKIILWALLIPYLFHLVAGLRHLLMDIQIGTSLRGGRLSAQLTFLITFLLVIVAGIWLW